MMVIFDQGDSQFDKVWKVLPEFSAFIKKMLYPSSFLGMAGRPLCLLQKHEWLLLKRSLHCGKQICFGRKNAVCKEASFMTLDLFALRGFS